MNFSIRNTILALSLFLSIPLIHTQEVPVQQAEQLSAEQFDSFVTGVVTQLQKFGSIMQSLADQISAHQVQVTNKQELLKHIMVIKQNIANLEDQASHLIDGDINKVVHILQFIDFFAGHVKALVDDNLAKIPTLDPTDLKKKRTGMEPSIEAVAKQLEDTEVALVKLEQDAQQIGLSRFNKIFRKFEKFNNDYRITGRAVKAAVYVAAVCVLATIIDETELLKKIPGYKWLKNKVGNTPKFDNSDNLLQEADTDEHESGRLIKQKHLSFIGKSLSIFGPKGLNLLTYTFTPWLTWQAFGQYAKRDGQNIREGFDNVTTTALNFLRGGAKRTKLRIGAKQPTVTFKDGVGLDSIKFALTPYIEYLCATEAWDRANIAPEQGIIFAGSSRTGKTYMAEMLAGTVQAEMKARGIKQELTFLVFDASEVLELGVEVVLNYARIQAPCILFIDEMDMLGLQRGTNGSLLSKFLTQMSGALDRDANKRVIMIGATNKPKSLDTALLQFGRFGKVIWFELPTEAERQVFLQRECINRAFAIQPEFLIRLARETEGCSYETLHRILKTAAAWAKLRGSAVKQEDIEHAFDEEIREILPKFNELPGHQLHTIATHLAGQALATHLLDGQKQVSKVTVRPVKKRVVEEQPWDFIDKKTKDKDEPIEYGKVFTYNKDQKFSMPSHNDLIVECKTALAGHAAEVVMNGSTGYTYRPHAQKEAFKIAQYLKLKGMEPADLPKEERQALEKEAYQFTQQCGQEVTELLTQHKEQLAIIVEMLEFQQTITEQELTQLAKMDTEKIAALRKNIEEIKEEARAAHRAELEKLKAAQEQKPTAAPAA